MKIEKHIELLGKEATDKVTGAKGVITSVTFDLYGCIQGLLTPSVDKTGKRGDSHWCDLVRLKITKNKRVMPIPPFDSVYIVEGNKGCAIKPIK